MPWTAAAIVGGALIGSNAASNAADSQSQSSQAAIDEQRRQFDLTRSDYAPYRSAGVDALGQLQTDINQPTTAADVMSDPGYQFGLDQGQLALDRKFAASGGRVSGAAMKAAAQYGTNYATTGYGAAYQRSQDRLNRLAALAGVGQTATAGSAAAGAGLANAISGILQSQGNATGAAQLAQGSIWGGAGNQLAALYTRQTKSPDYVNWNSGTGGSGSSGSWGGPVSDPWYG
jgi:hypothetical protein